MLTVKLVYNKKEHKFNTLTNYQYIDMSIYYITLLYNHVHLKIMFTLFTV